MTKKNLKLTPEQRKKKNEFNKRKDSSKQSQGSN